MLKDYDMSVYYHSGKANVVVDVLSRLSMGNISHVEEEKKELVKEVHQLDRFGCTTGRCTKWGCFRLLMFRILICYRC